MTEHELKIEALNMALRATTIGEDGNVTVTRAKVFLAFLKENDTPNVDHEEQGIDRTLPVGLFDQMHEHEKADTKPWRSSRGLE